MRTTRWAVIAALCIPLALTTLAGSLMAQRRPYPTVAGYTPVIIAVTDNFPYSGADAVIVRRRAANDHDVILVRQGKAQPPLLAEAVLTMQAVRSQFGDLPSADQVVRVQEQPTPRGRVAEAAMWMRRINDATPREVPELGNLKYVRILLPNAQ